jgi:hypothetical protein
MKHLSSQAIGHEVSIILKSGQQIEGHCILSGDSYVKVEAGLGYVWDIDAEDIAALGIKGA